MKPLSESEQRVVLGVARDKAEEELMVGEVVGQGEEQRVVARLVEAIVTHIRTHKLLQPVPRTRQVRHTHYCTVFNISFHIFTHTLSITLLCICYSHCLFL